ncbi:hypothetical protein LI90_381 [Carbonactinospora thermoautotrophica]|uniref:Uncharacterized protein n=1 Tax=Carbonactinospora thermoautotrophica TaxID=1469144 RepID=A0A132MLK9_9ACTN|nr:hypothetical protein LI90_381 [Carbonactinospora thermoautotrophica]
MRGEDFFLSTQAGRDTGSPPRAWGGLSGAGRADLGHRITPTCVGRTQVPQGGSRLRRITPTCVGRTCLCFSARWYSADHPHVRGEDTAAAASPFSVVGSPPRAWGGLPHEPK